ncbi:hypothetical protein QA641_15930 [Bradyrhizobium sp. CB1650]|nr:hypothetical protein [Bradyrhizobium sp. CB1650]WGD55232.1 hypothetical protein QA641_15930 [Bradyrhizobium sp. CB1650]
MTELENDDERELEDAEPSLGSLDRARDQTRWAMAIRQIWRQSIAIA